MSAGRDLAGADTIGDGEYSFSRRDFREIAAILNDEAGIALADGKASLVYARLVGRLRALGLRSFREYCALVRPKEGGLSERVRMIAALTTNVTRFFREPHHFEDFRKNALPPLLHLARQGGRVRFWSAGCASGEEPYSIALSILEAMPDAPHFDIRILATDIDPEVLQIARNGVYSEAAIAPIDSALRERFLFPDRRSTGAEKNWVVAQAVRSMVAFRRLNLIAPWPMKGTFHAIYCRNVVIYFDEERREEVWRRMAKVLVPAGRLYIGHSERVADVRTPLAPIAHTIYKTASAASEGDYDARSR